MNVLIFLCLSDIFLNLPSSSLAFDVNCETSNSAVLSGIQEDYVNATVSKEAESDVFSGAKEPSFFPGLMPEVVRYAKHRCSHDLPNANVNWGVQIFSNEAEAHDTHCYVKCFLRRVGLIQLHTLGWDTDRLLAMLANLRGHQNLPTNCLDSLCKTGTMNGKCEPYYEMWMKIRQDCQFGFNAFFYYDVRLEELPFEEPLPLYREPGVEPYRFCSAVLKEDSVDMKSPQFSLCIYSQLHYIDSYGRIDASEIIHSFTGSAHLTAHNERVIRNCAHLANSHFILGQNSEEMAQHMTTCLTKKIPDDYSFVLQYWNQVMRDY
uniref:Odorant-binding protein n=1 Tax=Bactrocera latifrons TaxID=174628 RepID=A0A0K8W4W9_BACLA